MVQRAMEAGSARKISRSVRAWGAALLMSSCLACSSAPDTRRGGDSAEKASEVKEPVKREPSTQELPSRREGESADVDAGALASFVRERLKHIQNCYEEQLKLNPKLQGKVVVLFSIQPTGRVGETGIEEDTLGNEAVGSCIRALMSSWEFPFRPKEEVQIAYPFIFSPAE